MPSFREWLKGEYAIGRRKESVAKVWVIEGTGKIIINGKRGDEYLQFNIQSMEDVRSPLVLIGLENRFDIHANTHGGGLKGQVGAIKLGLARFFANPKHSYLSANIWYARSEQIPPGMKPEDFQDYVRRSLRSSGFLTRDSRVKERKKYGLKKARKAPQFSKR
jgi:small subunit ribosomal protein S9